MREEGRKKLVLAGECLPRFLCIINFGVCIFVLYRTNNYAMIYRYIIDWQNTVLGGWIQSTRSITSDQPKLDIICSTTTSGASRQ